MYADTKEKMIQDEEGLRVFLINDLEHAFRHLVSLYHAQLFAFVVRQTGSPQDAEDIVQDALIQAYVALKGYPDQRVQTLKIQPWLYKITLNSFYMQRRKCKLQAVSLEELEAKWGLEQPNELVAPALVQEGERSLAELARLVAGLPDQYREVINLFYFEHLSYQEITEVLNMPMGTVKSYLYRGVQQLRKAANLAKQEEK